MNTIATPYKTMDDLVFENRNHSYGAYTLRQKYSKHLSLALATSLGAFALALTVPEFLKGEGKTLPPITLGPIVDMTEPPTIIIPPVPQTITPPPPPPPSVRNLTPVAVDREVEDELPTNAERNRPVFNGPETGTGDVVVPDFNDGDIVASIGEPAAEVDKPFLVVEKMPEFDGDLNRYLSRNLRYPETAVSQEVEGRVFLSFVVGKDGSISDIKVLKGISKECDEEAVRVVRKMPLWRAGKQSGRAVAVQFSLPISFKLTH